MTFTTFYCLSILELEIVWMTRRSKDWMQ